MRKSNLILATFAKRTGLFTMTSLLLLNSGAFASPGTTSGELLKIPVGARAIAMGEAYTAAADDSSSLVWNPAGMALAQQKEASFMHSSLIESVNYEDLAFISPGEFYSVGANMSYLGYGSIAGYDNNGASIGNQSAYAYDFSGGLATTVLNSLSLGVTGSFLRESLAGTSANTFAANLGAIYAFSKHFLDADYRVGATVENLGPGLKFVSESGALPRRITLGAAIMYVKQKPLNLTMDIGFPSDNSDYVSFGGEYWFKDLLALRFGYAGTNNEGKGLRMGVGLKFRGLLFDYAYGGYGDFGATQQVQMSFRFGDRMKQLNNEQRKVLREAKINLKQGDEYAAIVKMNEILVKDPTNDAVLAQMIKTHEQMLKKELNEAVAEGKQDIPSPEAEALSNMVPGQAQAAQAAGDDPLGLSQLPDATRLDDDADKVATMIAAPEPTISSKPQAIPTVEPGAATSNSSAATDTMITPSDIYGGK